MDCIFCKIIKGEIPCYKIYEDSDCLTFLDIAKEAYGHTLIVPKKHSSCLMETDASTLQKCMNVVKKVGDHYIKNCGYDGFNIIINNGESAGQSVHHLHIHLIPRKKGDCMGLWHLPIDETDLAEVQKHLQIVEEEVDDNKIVLYTDGACSGNPGAGGYCAILRYNGKEKVISGGDAETTNNRMELLGVISGLKALKKSSEVDVYSDSAYVVNAFLEDWISYWVAHNWMTKGKKEVANVDLWQELIELTRTHKVVWHKVKGHADNELNNRCDEIARSEIEKYKEIK